MIRLSRKATKKLRPKKGEPVWLQDDGSETGSGNRAGPDNSTSRPQKEAKLKKDKNQRGK